MAHSFGYFKFRERLENKCKLLGKRLVIVNEYYTSKSCCSCGIINHNLGSNKVLKCLNCDLEIDRDINGSINILLKGLSNNK